MSEARDGTDIPLGFGGGSVSIGDHIGHFYRGEGEMFTVLGAYIAEGIRRGENCAVMCSPRHAESLKDWLRSQGIDADRAEESGQLILHPGEATVTDMTALFDRVQAESADAGYKFVRLAGDGGSTLMGQTSSSEMLRWEALYDQLSVDWQMVALCQFDLERFGGDVVMDALRAHPLCVIGQVMVRNPFHVSPQTLLQEFSQRE